MKFSILLACVLLVGCNGVQMNTSATIKLTHPVEGCDIEVKWTAVH